MADFNPDSADRKLVLQSLTAKHERIISIIQNSEPRGFVTWQADSGHDAFYRALQIGLSFLRTNCFDEWVVMGSGVFAVVRGMPIFKELDDPEWACGMVHAGNIRKMKVYLRPWPDQISTELYIGHDNSCVKAVALDFPVAYADEQPVQAEAGAHYGVDPNMLPAIAPEAYNPIRDRNEEFERAAALIHRDQENAAKDRAASPLWRALLGAVLNDNDEDPNGT